jgi:hypothetical protein
MTPTKSRNWFQKHNRLLTFFGALIVFLTFVVREGLRDQLKDLVDSIDSAQNAFLLSVLSTESPMAFNRLEREVLSIRTQRQSGHTDPSERDIKETWLLIAERIERARITLNDISRLQEKLPAKDQTVLLFSGVEDELAKCRENYAHVQKIGPEALEPDPTQYSGESYPFGELDTATRTLIQRVGQLGSLVWEEADIVRRSDEFRLRIYTWATYFLYAFGWCLGLVGRLHGVGGAGTD